jgi:hypothetical protein
MENCHVVDTLMAASTTKFMVPYSKQARDEDIKLYGLKIGSLMYLVVQTRLDIAYRVSVLSRFLSNPLL